MEFEWGEGQKKRQEQGDGSAVRTNFLGKCRTFCPETNFRAVMETIEALIIPKLKSEEVTSMSYSSQPSPPLKLLNKTTFVSVF